MIKEKTRGRRKNLARKFFHSLAGGNRTAQIFNLDRRSVTITETSSSASVEKWQSVLPRLSLEFNLRWNDFLLLLALCFVHEKCQQWKEKKFHRCFPLNNFQTFFLSDEACMPRFSVFSLLFFSKFKTDFRGWVRQCETIYGAKREQWECQLIEVMLSGSWWVRRKF